MSWFTEEYICFQADDVSCAKVIVKGQTLPAVFSPIGAPTFSKIWVLIHGMFSVTIESSAVLIVSWCICVYVLEITICADSWLKECSLIDVSSGTIDVILTWREQQTFVTLAESESSAFTRHTGASFRYGRLDSDRCGKTNANVLNIVHDCTCVFDIRRYK